MAKQAVQKHAKTTLSNFRENGRMMRLTVDVSEISHAVIILWKDKEIYNQFGFDEMKKFNQMKKEMGAVLSVSEGEASGEISKIFNNKPFEKCNCISTIENNNDSPQHFDEIDIDNELELIMSIRAKLNDQMSRNGHLLSAKCASTECISLR